MADSSAVTALLQRCKEQDREAFAELFRRYQRRVFATAFYITRRHDDADEITQLVFLELFSAVRRFDLARPFLPWLYRIVHNVSMDYLHRHYRNRVAPLPERDEQLDRLFGPDGDPGPEEHAEWAESRHAIWHALDLLPANQRAVLVLRYYGGLNEAELAEALRCRRGTVKSRLHRAHHALAAALARVEGAVSVRETESAPLAAAG